MMSDFEVYTKADELPKEWDLIAGGHIFMKREFLVFLERVNYCRQKYYIAKDKGIIWMSYRLKIDIASFTRHLSLKMPIRILGLPISLSVPAYICPDEHMGFLRKYLQSFPLLLVLNTDGALSEARGKTLPAYVIEDLYDFKTYFDDYLSKINSNERRRLKKALGKSDKLDIRKISREDFSLEHYKLYEQVYNRSKAKLEKLSIEYFKEMDASIYEVRAGAGTLLAFCQLKIIQDEMIFLFCGLDKESNQYYDTYINMLLFMLELACDNSCKRLHLGQTTAYSKTLIGAFKEEKSLHICGYLLPYSIRRYLAGTLGR